MLLESMVAAWLTLNGVVDTKSQPSVTLANNGLLGRSV